MSTVIIAVLSVTGRPSGYGAHLRHGAAVSEQSTYTFGDTDAAAARLGVVARVFEPLTRRLIDEVAADPVDVLDLGCGPGHTTRLLANRFPSAHIIGVDASTTYVKLAAHGAPANATFAPGDVTDVLPGTPVDMIYARLLLAHLPDPAGLVDAWSRQLRPGGLLVIEEPEAIHTGNAVLTDYLRVVTALIAARGADMYAGRAITGCHPCGTDVMLDRLAGHDVAMSDAADMFIRNLGVWRGEAVEAGVATSGELDRLEHELTAHRDASASCPVYWDIRQMAIVRT